MLSGGESAVCLLRGILLGEGSSPIDGLRHGRAFQGPTPVLAALAVSQLGGCTQFSRVGREERCSFSQPP